MRNSQTKFNSDSNTITQKTYFEERASVSTENEKKFNLRELFEGVFSKLHPLFSIDCGALILYNDELTHITRVYLSEVDDGQISCVETISDPVSLSLITKEISAFDFPVLKSRQDWVDDFGENHCLTNHPTEYHFHGYIPIEHNGHIFGTFELHNHNRELSADGLTFCCNTADFMAGLLAVMQQKPHTDIVDHSPKNNSNQSFVAISDKLMLAGSRTEVVNIVEAHFLKEYHAQYAELLISSTQEFIFDSSFLTETINEFDVKALNEKIVKKVYLDLWVENEVIHVVAIPLLKSTEVIGQLLLGFKGNINITADARFKSIINIVVLAAARLLAEEKSELQQKQLEDYDTKISGFITHVDEVAEPVYTHPGIVGSSAEMQEVYSLLNRIANSETTILILGETGTGKELIAKAVHDASNRKETTMIKVNCAAIPPNLIESELFGHEKGSFTGATERRVGKFEQAHKGTIFLDEIGELTLDLQVKLLRVLQEKEIERVGGKVTIPTDVRIISATNRNLLEEVEAGKFRSDLFYRLNVFPVSLPPLRNRKTDIPVLASYFLKKYANKSNRNIIGFSKKAMDAMIAYNWPGNVRELEHLIERQVVMTKGSMVKDIGLAEVTKTSISVVVPQVKTIFENERDHIFLVLELCNGKISGANGAAKLLGVPATTLNSKIKRLGLSKKHIF